jgi:serine/threonine protein kinase
MNLVGKTIGQYQIVEEIGSGGMATVYKGYQPTLDRHVAIKVLAGQLAKDETFRMRFAREAQAVAGLRHPHIVQVYDYGEVSAEQSDLAQDIIYLVTEYIDAGTLKERLGIPMDPGDAARIAAEIAEALDFAHRKEIIHRDVKPSNILLSQGGDALLADFGIARMSAGTQYTQTGTTVGTPAYMSPEQARGQEVDRRTDLYSLGVVLYEMLTGRVPFTADTPLGIAHLHVFEPPPPPRGVHSKIPRRLEKVILRALAKEPSERYRTGREMAKALGRAVTLNAPGELPALSPDQQKTVALSASKDETSRRLTETAGRVATQVGRGAFHLGWGVARWVLRVGVALLLALTVLSILVLLGSSFLLSSLAERSIPEYAWGLDQFTAFDQELTISQAEMNLEVGPAIEPYALDLIQDTEISLREPDAILVSARVVGQPARLQTRLTQQDGVPRIILERLNNVPLYVIGGIISGGVNRGLEAAFEGTSIHLERLEVEDQAIVFLARNQSAPARAPTPALTATPAAGALATPQRRIAGTGTAAAVARPTQRQSVPPVPTNTARATSAAARRAVLPTATPSPNPCRNPQACITSPADGARVSGTVTIRGTAVHPEFQYYKLEFGLGPTPQHWAVLGALQSVPVVDGVLGTWDASPLPAGVYSLRLVVVDQTGNYPEPSTVWVLLSP